MLLKRASDRKQVSKPYSGDRRGQLAKMLRDLKPEHGLAQVWSVLPASTLAAASISLSSTSTRAPPESATEKAPPTSSAAIHASIPAEASSPWLPLPLSALGRSLPGRRIALAEGEHVGLDAGSEEGDLERAVDDRSGLANQLIEPRLPNHSVAFFVHVESVRIAGRFAVDEHLEWHGCASLPWSQGLNCL